MSLRDYLKTVLQGVKTYTDDTFLKKNQGESNNGKYLVVGADGNIGMGDAPSGDEEDEWIQLLDITIEEATQSIDIKTDINGENFLCKKFRFTMVNPATGIATAMRMTLYNGSNSVFYSTGNVFNTAAHKSVIYLYRSMNMFHVLFGYHSSNSVPLTTSLYGFEAPFEKFDAINLRSIHSSGLFEVGCIIKVWGCKA